jgi:hypothetical protein
LSAEQTRCPICKLSNFNTSNRIGLTFEITCSRCGVYRLNTTLIPMLSDKENDPLLLGLSAYARQQSEKGIIPEFHSDNWKDLATGHINVPVLKKLEMLERVIADRSAYPGFAVKMSEHDFPLVDAASSDELDFLVDSLQEAGQLIKPQSGMMGNFLTCMLTARGWATLQEQTLSGIPAIVMEDFH